VEGDQRQAAVAGADHLKVAHLGQTLAQLQVNNR
jgi:hypothetical protein